MDTSMRANEWTIDLRALVVMPDHIHMIFTPLVDVENAEVFSLARITKGIKGTSAHLIKSATWSARTRLARGIV
jgi:REP element-mobilizing transposase RayT